MRKLLLLISLMLIPVAADAGFHPFKAWKERKQVMKHLKKQSFNPVTNRLLDIMIHRAISVAEEHGDEILAKEINFEYQMQFKGWFSSIHAKELGDHGPLVEWLDRLYSQLESVVGERVMEMTHLEDIKIFNYAIPVVYQPVKDRRENYDWKAYCGSDCLSEYVDEHFVDYSAASVYWLSYVACMGAAAASEGAFSPACGVIAEALRFSTEKFIGPKVGRFVYRKANGLD